MTEVKAGEMLNSRREILCDLTGCNEGKVVGVEPIICHPDGMVASIAKGNRV
jgi:hypothetical protein